jgi:polyisoprenoid-binding protein YceI
VNSINTGNEMRDGHLKSSDFFDAANYPKMTFVSKSFTRKNANDYELKGEMTIRGTSKEIFLNVVYNGLVKGLDGSDISAFEITGNLNRFDYGLHWNVLTEAGGVVVGSDVKLEIIAEMKMCNHLKKQLDHKEN